MAKLSGQFLTVQIDDSAGVPRDTSTDVESVDIPDEFGELDVTGFSDGAVNSIPGMPSFPVEVAGNFNPAATTGLFTVLNGIKGSTVSKTLDVRIGQGAAPIMGDPRFTGEFWLQKLNISATPQGKIGITASFRPMGAVAPTWGTVP